MCGLLRVIIRHTHINTHLHSRPQTQAHECRRADFPFVSGKFGFILRFIEAQTSEIRTLGVCVHRNIMMSLISWLILSLDVHKGISFEEKPHGVYFVEVCCCLFRQQASKVKDVDTKTQVTILFRHARNSGPHVVLFKGSEYSL